MKRPASFSFKAAFGILVVALSPWLVAEESIDWAVVEDLAFAAEEWVPLEQAWRSSFSLTGGLGYADNLTRSSFLQKEYSVYQRIAGEALFQFDWDNARGELALWLTGEARHWSELEALEDAWEWESALFLHAQRRIGEDFALGLRASHLAVQAFYDYELQQDLGARSTVLNYGRSQVEGTGIWYLNEEVELEAGLVYRTLDYDLDYNNYDEQGLRLQAAWREILPHLDFLCEVSWWRRDYANRRAQRANGVNIPGSELAYTERGVRLELQYRPSEPWQIRAMSGLRGRDDNAGGYQNFVRYSGTLQIAYQQGPWQGNVELEALHYIYEDAFVRERLPAGQQRTWSLWNPRIGLSRELGEHWSAQVTYHFENARSRHYLPGIDEYTYQSVETALRWRY